MASEDNILGDVLSIGGSEDEAVPFSKKRDAEAAATEQQDSRPAGSDSRATKRQRLSQESVLTGADGDGSEDGEIDGNSAEQSRRGSTSPQSRKGTDHTATMQAANPLDVTGKAFMPNDPPTFKSGDVFLKLPSLSSSTHGSWTMRATDWITLFCSANPDHAALITPQVAIEAFNFYIDEHSTVRNSRRSAVKKKAKRIEELGQLPGILAAAASNQSSLTTTTTNDKVASSATSNQKDDVESTITATKTAGETVDQIQAAATISNNNTVANSSPVQIPIPTEATADQRRYFPSASNPAEMCLLCGRAGHVSLGCTHSKCRFCNEQGHWDFVCSAIGSRCTKCRQLGHSASACVEKLALTKDEGLACVYCKEPDHLEGNCTEPWRSFHPDGESVKTVLSIEASCAVCGSRNHFASDCTLRGKDSINSTWTLRNRNLYINPATNNVSIEVGVAKARAPPTRPRPETKIRGHASRTHIHYSETDDSDTEFLGNHAVKKPAQVGQIRLASNIQLPSKPQHQPPLPAGPPPSQPPPPGVGRYNSYHPIATPPSLPVKPPPSRDYRHAPPPPPPPPSQPSRNRRASKSRNGPPSRGGPASRGGSRNIRGKGRGRARGR